MVPDTYRHDAWGVLLACTGGTVNPHTYVGRERYYLMPEAEMYHLGFRDYAQGIGRFMTVDPARDGLSWALYVLNRPAFHTDAKGLAAHAMTCCTLNSRAYRQTTGYNAAIKAYTQQRPAVQCVWCNHDPLPLHMEGPSIGR